MTSAPLRVYEPALPHLSRLLDPRTVRRVLLPRLLPAATADAYAMLDCTIERVKYHPGKNCLVVFRFDDRAGRAPTARVACRTYERHGARSRFEKARAAGGAAPDVLHLPEIEAVAWVFPHDRKLHHLPRLLDATWFSGNVLPALQPMLAQPTNPAQVSLQLAHYVPEHTGSVRVELQWPHAPCSQTIYGKTYYDDRGEEAARLQREIYRALASHPDLAVPCPLHYERATRTFWQAAVPGHPAPAWCGLAEAERAKILRGLTAFHSLRIAEAPPRTLVDLDLALHTAVNLISRALPGVRALVSQIVPLLASRLPILYAHDARATLHGDLHPGNLLIDDARLNLIDLDSVQTGPAALDLGSYVASELYRALLAARVGASAGELVAQIAQAYNAAHAAPISRDALAIGTAFALVTERARRCITRLKPGRLELTEELLAIACSLVGTVCEAAA